MLTRQEIDALKASIDLVAFIGQDVPLKSKRGGTIRGGQDEHCGPCPFCGGTDRFIVLPSHPKGYGVWYCRGCERNGTKHSGDIVDYLMLRSGLSFTEAIEQLSKGTAPLTLKTRPPSRPEPESMRTSEDEPPSRKWQERIRAFVRFSQAKLWDSAGEKARVWLSDRGLLDETIKLFGLGFNTKDRWDRHPEAWGVQGVKAIYMSVGIVIPGEIDGKIYYAKVRRPHLDKVTNVPDALSVLLGNLIPSYDKTSKYSQPRGGATNVLFMADRLCHKECILLTEGELDAMLAWQEMADLVDVASIGGVQKRESALRGRWLLPMLTYRAILVGFDTDGPGRKWAADVVKANPRAHEIRVPRGNDVTAYHRGGGNLRAWLQGELARLGLSS